MSEKMKPKTTFERGAVLFMAFVCAISLLAVSGWMFNLPLLASLHPEYIPMAPSTALIFLGLSGAALIYGDHPSRRGTRILVQTGLVVMGVSVLLLIVRTYTGLGPNLEQIFFPNPTLFGEIETARMSPLTALGFILAIPAFLLLTRREPGRRTKSASAALSLAVFIFSGLITLSYLYGAPPFYGGTLIPLALPTAISFLFLSLGLLLAAGPTCWPVRMFVGPALKARLMRAIIPTAMAIVLLQGHLSTAGGLWILNPAFKVAFAALVAGLIFVFIISVIAQNFSTDIERGRQAEEALQAISYRQQVLLAAVPDIIMEVDNHEVYTWANQPGQKFFGPDVVGHETAFYFAGEQEAYQKANPLFEGAEKITYSENWQRRKDGQKRLLAWWRHRLEDANGNVTGILSSARDITEQRLVEIALIDERNLLVTLLDNIPDMIYFKDAESRIVRANNAHARRFGFDDPAQLVGKTDFDLFGEEHAQAAYEDEQEILRSGQPLVAKDEMENFLDGHTLWVSTTKMPLRDHNGQISGTFGISRDITARKRYELVQNATYRITQAAITCDGIDALCQSIHANLGELIAAENFFIALYDSVTGSINFPYFIDQYDTAPTAPVPIRGLTGYVIRTGRPILATREIYAELVQQGEVKPAGTAAEQMIRMPLKIEGRIIGVIGVQSYIKEKHFHQDDVDLLEFVSTLVAQAIERKRLEEEIRSLSLTDELSGLFNRRGFTLLAEREVKLARRMKRSMLLFFCDVDGLKTINDSLGHAQGDQALKDISSILKQIFRESDIVARMGGDEFVVLAVDASPASAEAMANRIQATLEEHNRQKDASYQLSLSLGVAFYDPAAPSTVSELISQADGLMYAQKQARKRKAGGF